jgi:hypothetical protein
MGLPLWCVHGRSHEESVAVTEFFSSLLRGLFMLAAGVLVLTVAAVLLLFTVSFVLVATVWGLLNGRKPSARAQWARFQQSAASTVWQRYREQATGTPRTAASASASASTAPARNSDVEDVDYRDIPSTPPRHANGTRSVES